jgi:3-phosphoshikimate 1-carboxyvinyltransferase
MGAAISSDGGRPPLHIRGHWPLRAIDYALPIASAQVKSAVLLAGLYADGATRVKEPAITRDHTERMLETMGARISRSAGGVEIAGGQQLAGRDIRVPSDLSSAAFLILAALLGADTDICIVDVGVNPTRTGVIDILKSMGGDITLENPRWFGREPVADIRVRASELRGGAIDPALVSLAIDEFPVLFIAAAAATGRTTFSGIGELRVKESDRIAVMAAGLRALGIDVDESDDGAVIRGGQIGGGEVDSHGDHRVAMSFAVAGTVASSPVTIRDVAAVDTSFPGFCDSMRNLGVNIRCSGKSP